MWLSRRSRDRTDRSNLPAGLVGVGKVATDLELLVGGPSLKHALVHVVGEVGRVCPQVVVVGEIAHCRRAVGAAGSRLLTHRNALEPEDARRIGLTITWRGGGGGGRAPIIDRRDASEWQAALYDRRNGL